MKMDPDMELEIRQARHDDYEDVVEFTQDTWSDRGEDDDWGDYIPSVFEDWVDSDGEDQRTFVVDTGDDIAGIAQCVILSEYEAWGQGMRVNPEYRGQGIATQLTHDLFDWARDQGAKIIRNMVFSWNGAGLGNSRYVGYEPITQFRWGHPEVEEKEVDAEVTNDVDDAWGYWVNSDACTELEGLSLDMGESWALSNLTRERLEKASEESEVIAVRTQEDGVTGMSYRAREYERENDEGEMMKYADYGVGAWDDVESCKALYDAIADDAHELGADEVRVLIPENTRFVSDTAVLRVDFSDDPDFILGADLTRDYREFTRKFREKI